MPIFPKNPTSNEVISIGSKNWKFNSTDGVWDKIGGSDPAVVGSTFDHVDNGITLNGETLSVDTTATIELVGIAHAGDANTKLVFGTHTLDTLRPSQIKLILLIPQQPQREQLLHSSSSLHLVQ